MRINKYMMTVQYPNKPPPTFARKVLAIDEEGLALTERPVDSLTVFRIRRALYPSALTMSLWTFTGALMKQNADSIGRLIGYGSSANPSTAVQDAMDKMQQRMKTISETKTFNPGASDQPSEKAQAGGKGDLENDTVNSRSGEPPMPSGSSMGRPIPEGPNAETGKQKSAKDIYAIKVAQEHTSGPWQAFKQTLAQTWKPLGDYPPRGSISVSGLVEVDAPRAVLTIEAAAWWDPKTKRFDSRSLTLRLKNLRPKKQVPLR